MVVADGLTEENLLSVRMVPESHGRMEVIFTALKTECHGLKTGKKDEIRFQDQTVIRLVGFVGSDRLRSGESVKLMTDGRITGLPLYAA